MKIIKKGSLPEEKVKRITCRKCSTVFEFQLNEARYNIDQRDGDFYSIDCPLCKEYNTFAVNNRLSIR